MVAQLVKNLPAMQEPLVQFLGQEDTLEKGFLGFPGGSDNKESACADSKESACNAGDLGSIPGWERYPAGEHGNSLQYSCLENCHGQRSLEGYSPWGHKESDMTDRLSTAHSTSKTNKIEIPGPTVFQWRNPGGSGLL